MAPRSLWAALAMATTATANLVDFHPLTVFDANAWGGNSDLLVFVEKGKSLGRSPFDKTLRVLDSGDAGLARPRTLVVSSCRGCAFYDELMSRWRLTEAELPVAVLFPDHDENSEKGKFRLDLAAVEQPLEQLVRFVRGFDAGLLRPWVRGAPGRPAEEAAEAGPVLEVFGPTFLQEVVDPDVAALMLLYAPFCGFSKQLQPVFEEVGRKFAGNPHLRIARMDTTQNELPTSRFAGHVDVSRVPRIYLYPKGKKTSPEVYPPEAERTPAALLAWLQGRVAPEALAFAAPQGAEELLDGRGEF